jgi:hypothetical protein
VLGYVGACNMTKLFREAGVHKADIHFLGPRALRANQIAVGVQD